MRRARTIAKFNPGVQLGGSYRIYVNVAALTFAATIKRGADNAHEAKRGARTQVAPPALYLTVSRL